MPKGIPRRKVGKKITSADVKEWIKECAFASDMEACKALEIPFRTFGRWKANGVPMKTEAAKYLSHVIEARMIYTLERRRARGQA